MSFGPSIDGSKWRIKLTALDGTVQSGSGQVFNASSKSFTYQLGGGRQMVFTMNSDNPRTPFVLNNDCLGKVYRKGRDDVWRLVLVGDVVSTEEKAQGDIATITCTIADPFWRLTFRYLGVGVDSFGRGVAFTLGNPNSVPITTRDTGLMIQDILVAATGFNTKPVGIQLGGVQTTGQQQVLGPMYAVTAADTIQQVSQTVAGPDVEIVPVEPSGSMPNTIIGTMNVWSHLGTLSPPPSLIFEYGIGRHTMASYDRIVTKNTLANDVFSLPQGYPTMSADNDTIIATTDPASQAARGLFQYYTNDNLTSPGLRQALVNETLAILKQPRQQLSIVPVVDCPIDWIVDYNIGDLVQVRAYDKITNTMRFGGTLRLYGIQIDVDEQDAESITLTCTPDSASGTTFPNVPSVV